MTQPSDDRYAALLQPIRDMASNWSIDIAHELEDYLEVLEGVQFSFAEGGPSLNFAEAALLIQGSACIYSKKVEYLHTLVYQALEFIAERRKRDARIGGEGAEGTGGEGGTEEDDEFEDEEQFLSLDDVLEEGTSIDLDDAVAVAQPGALRPPATLLALEDTGNSHGGDGDAGNYRIASCAVHRSGALLLEQRDGQTLGEDLQPVSSEVGAGGGNGVNAAPYWAPTAGGAATVAAAAAQQSGDGQQQPPQHQMEVDGGEFGDDGYDDFGGGGGGFEEDDYYPGGAFDPDSQDAGLAAEAWAGGGARPAAGAGGKEGEGEEEVFDPYKPLDPNSRGTFKPKPFKKAAKVPRKPRARQQQRRAPQVLDGLLTLQPPPSGLLFPEFAYALRQQEAVAKASQGGAGGGSRATSQRSAQTTAAAFTYEEAVAGFAAAEADDEDAAGGDYFDGGGMGFDDNDDYAPLGDFALPDGMAAPTAAAATAAMEGDWGAPMGDGGFDGGDGDELTYEELCRAHIEAFINAAAAAEVQSELAARVSGWRAKMAPALEEEDARPEFDIHQYGDRILQRIAELTCGEGDASAGAMRRGQLAPVTFGQVVGVGPKYEASRSFSSMLQLINNGNVRITKLGGGGRGEEEGGFTLTLLDRVLPHKKVTDYRALGSAGAAAQQGAAKAAAAGQQQKAEEDGEWGENLVAAAAVPAAKQGRVGGSKAKRQKG